jgi:hypothetical protein
MRPALPFEASLRACSRHDHELGSRILAGTQISGAAGFMSEGGDLFEFR